jgi:uncharacterized membrane protein YqaE (UPF0057 family)
MKTTSLYSVIAVLAFASLLSSCAFLQKGEFAQRKYYDFPRSKHAENSTASTENKKQDVPGYTIAAKEEQKLPAPVVSASVNKKEIIVSGTVTRNSSPKHLVSNKTTVTEHAEAPAISFKKSDVKKQAKKLNAPFRRSDAGLMMFIMVLAAIFIPPLGIYIKDHRTNKWFWITLLLCLVGGGGYMFYTGLMGLFWLVAVIIALMDVFDML